MERDGRTILEWQKALGQKCESFHLALCTLIGLTLMSLQMDEIWSYLRKKKRQLWLFITLFNPSHEDGAHFNSIGMARFNSRPDH